MASDYEAIRDRDPYEVVERAGRRLADLYADSTHFIFELLQNAEDALRRRDGKPKSRTVKFDLAERELRVSHYGKPFDGDDVKGICDIGKGTKEEDITQIGKFGIGFKSVYKFTDRPEIHSGNEDFTIDKFILPSAQPAIERDRDQTVFVLPLRKPEANRGEIADGLRRIKLDTLLFLRKIDSVKWVLPSGESGTCVQRSERLDHHVRQVTLIGQVTDQDDTDQDWLVFSKAMHGDCGKLAGHVEVAFSLKNGRIVPISRSPLVAFFPTDVETHLGLRIQGPYRTTPSRDNVPRGERWNQTCVEMTGELLVDALLWLREKDMLDVDVLLCLPLDRTKFGADSMFEPLFAAIMQALRSKKLLPTLSGGYTSGERAKLGRSNELRELISGKQLKRIFNAPQSISWLTELISQDRTPELRRYLMDELDVEEVTPQSVLPKLGTSFLERQSDAWMCRLYEFLNGQAAQHRQAKVMPIVRLSNGRHVHALADGVPQVFLPSATKTGFPTVHKRACRTEEARQFLEAIGLTLPDSVDDVIQNVLPRYEDEADFDDDVRYAEDIDRIVDAFQTDSSSRREELLRRLRKTTFLCAVDAADHSYWATPGEVYFRTDRLASLFNDVEDILFVHPRYDCLRGEKVRNMLSACGASRYLRAEEVDCDLSIQDLEGIRRNAGLERMTWGRPRDQTLHGVQALLDHMAKLGDDERRKRAETLWDALADVAAQTPSAFLGSYTWSYYRERKIADFDAAIVRSLNATAWVPSDDGHVRVPSEVSFETLGWRSEPLLLSKISFRPAEIDLLADKVDIEADVLYLLKEHGLTNVAAFSERLGLARQRDDDEPSEGVEGAIAKLGLAPPPAPSNGDPNAIENERDYGSDSRVGGHLGSAEAQNARGDGGNDDDRRRGTNEGGTVSRSAVTFHSYVAVDHDDDGDADAHEERRLLEEAAIVLILSDEQAWHRTPQNNEGFDLVKFANGQECAWCEVKAMKGTLHDRPATMSHAQFKFAQTHGNAYWLYVVEHAGSDKARIVRIQDPAGKAKTFTFDKGWLDVAKVD